MANYLSIEKRKQIFTLLCEGNGIRGITRIVGCSKPAVTELQKRYVSIIDFLNRKYLKTVTAHEIEADEIRTFIHTKNNIKWIYIALDRKSRVVLHFHIGKRDAADARVFLSGLSDKLSEKSQVSTDCLKSYITAVSKTPFGYHPEDTAWIDLQRARYLGHQLGRAITNRVETHNGVVRQHVSRISRRTRCFSKKQEGLRQHLILFFFYYNFIKRHQSLKETPALEMGIIETPFTIDNLIEYDLMFTGKMTHKNTLKNYGRIEEGSVNLHDEMDEFLQIMLEQSGMKKGTKRGKYKKLRVA